MSPTRKPPVGRYYDLIKEVEVPDDYVLTRDIVIKAPTRAQMIALRQSSTDEEFDRAFLGDSYDAVVALFADRPEQEWNAFAADVHKHFYGAGAGEVPGKSGESTP
ncbi:hypothetical protein [Nocardia sp. NPDC057030]|uniref:hypothetical protein n=1 Tax=unclassified Nocardia TaxID=2637762 RepID=UPI003642469D